MIIYYYNSNKKNYQINYNNLNRQDLYNMYLKSKFIKIIINKYNNNNKLFYYKIFFVKI